MKNLFYVNKVFIGVIFECLGIFVDGGIFFEVELWYFYIVYLNGIYRFLVKKNIFFSVVIYNSMRLFMLKWLKII